MSRDYYEILGVDEKADKASIKKKYRELAKKYHPDRNHGDKASEEKFKDISEAYDVIGDENKRQQYDNMRRFGGGGGGMGGFPGGGHPGFGGGGQSGFGSQGFGGSVNINDLFGSGGVGDIFSALFGDNVRQRQRQQAGRPQRRGPQKGKNLRATVNISLVESALGTTRKLKVAIPEKCDSCAGSGTVKSSTQNVCSRCHGTGQVTQAQGGFSISRPCPSCLGRGVAPGEACGKCKGIGHTKKKKTIAVKIPPGIEHDGQIKLKGLGFPGKLNGPDGDLLIKVNIMSDQKFERKGNDIHTSADVTFPQAVLGGKIEVKTLTQKIKLSVKPGTQPGTVMRLRGAGIKTDDKAGDLFVTINLIVPTEINDKQKDLLEQFEEASKQQAA